MSRVYADFFKTLTAKTAPFPYQVQLAEGPWPKLLDVPTGLGKTAAVVVGWLYKRLGGDDATGRRLVYCLPMRVLVEQTADAAKQWCDNAAPLFAERGLPAPTVHKLLGGDIDKEWAERPENPRIVVGTQDMLLSRALNRGYAVSRYRWPMHFALLSNDCLWVFDETQLLGVGIETSAQLQALREKLGVIGPAHTIWMSATLAESQLATIDHPRPAGGWPSVRLGDADLSKVDEVRMRVGAKKAIAQFDKWKIGKEHAKDGRAEQIASPIVALHQERRGLTLVVVNRVSRAQALFESIRGAVGNGTSVALIHARFRSEDRKQHTAALTSDGDRIVVATQAVEAGIDVSARTLITELAPWPALVQRFGRCNRYGEVEDAQIRWIEIDTADAKNATNVALPYSIDELDEARDLLTEVAARGGDAGPGTLRELDYEPAPVVRPVLRRRDLIDLFDTTPDICGDDIDVSRYVRDGNDTDVQVFWRDLKTDPPPKDLAPRREELCRVSIAGAKAFFNTLEKRRKALAVKGEKYKDIARLLRAWVWDPLDRQWTRLRSPRPGQIVLLHIAAGGYAPDLGWTGEVLPRYPVPLVQKEGEAPDAPMGNGAHDDDQETVLQKGPWVRLPDHLTHVRDETRALTERLTLTEAYGEELCTAGLWHDVGKAHEVFQHKLLDPVEERPELEPDGEGPWAKSCHRLRAKDTRKHFRHELASALAWLADGRAEDARSRDLVAYLVAAHHGKVRMSIRSVPGEKPPDGDGDRLFARGVWDGDVLPPFEMPDGRKLDDVRLDLSVMQLGEGSWLERMLALRDAADLGPFRLALLETLVVVADWRASKKEEEGG